MSQAWARGFWLWCCCCRVYLLSSGKALPWLRHDLGCCGLWQRRSGNRVSHTLCAVKFPWWPTSDILVWQLHPSGEDKEGLCKQRTLPKQLRNGSAMVLALAHWDRNGTSQLFWDLHSCSFAPMSHLPAPLLEALQGGSEGHENQPSLQQQKTSPQRALQQEEKGQQLPVCKDLTPLY